MYTPSVLTPIKDMLLYHNLIPNPKPPGRNFA